MWPSHNIWTLIYVPTNFSNLFFDVIVCSIFRWLKFIYSEKATKFYETFPLLLPKVHTLKRERFRKILWQNHNSMTVNSGQKLGEDFAKFCGLLRIYELYEWNWNFEICIHKKYMFLQNAYRCSIKMSDKNTDFHLFDTHSLTYSSLFQNPISCFVFRDNLSTKTTRSSKKTQSKCWIACCITLM